MCTLKSILKLTFFLTFFVCINSKIIAQEVDVDEDDQPVTPKSQPVIPSAAINEVKMDNRLIGEWWTDSKSAIYGKIIFGPDGSFAGYTLVSDKVPFVNGKYTIKNGAIYVSILTYSPTSVSNRSNNKTFTYSSYSIDNGRLQLILGDQSAAYNYYRLVNEENQ